MEAVQFRIARPTNQLEAIIHFYKDGLGLPVIGSFENHEGYDGVMLGLPGHTHHLEFTRHTEMVNCAAPTKDNLLVLYFETPEQYNRAIKRLQDMGISPAEPENPYWKESSKTFEDPDGWRVVLYNGVFK